MSQVAEITDMELENNSIDIVTTIESQQSIEIDPADAQTEGEWVKEIYFSSYSINTTWPRDYHELVVGWIQIPRVQTSGC